VHLWGHSAAPSWYLPPPCQLSLKINLSGTGTIMTGKLRRGWHPFRGWHPVGGVASPDQQHPRQPLHPAAAAPPPGFLSQMQSAGQSCHPDAAARWRYRSQGGVDRTGMQPGNNQVHCSSRRSTTVCGGACPQGSLARCGLMHSTLFGAMCCCTSAGGVFVWSPREYNAAGQQQHLAPAC
jgi:hypothetical protein